MEDGWHVVLGSTGGAGNAIARALHDGGFRARAVNRSGEADLPEGIERIAADVTAPDGAAAAVHGAEIVYMAAQPPYHRWPEEFPGMLSTVVDATAAAGAKLVMVDNLYAYGPTDGPMSEDTPERADDRKGEVRRRMAEMLLEAHRGGRLRVAIGRASDYFGPLGAISTITALSVAPVAGKGALRWVGNLDAAHSVAYLPDIARAYVALGTSDRADGSVWILPHPPAVTGREFLEEVNRNLPEPRKTGSLSRTMLRIASPFHKPSRELLDVFYQWDAPYVVDDSRFRGTFGPFGDTPLGEAVAATVEAHRQG